MKECLYSVIKFKYYIIYDDRLLYLRDKRPIVSMISGRQNAGDEFE